MVASLLRPAFYFLIIISAAVLLVLWKFIFKLKIKEVILLLTVFCIAVGYYGTYSSLKYDSVLKYSGKEIYFIGKIIDYQEYSGDKTRYLLKGRINDKETVKIYVYDNTYDFSISDEFYLEGTLKIPENDYLFDSRDYYKSNGIYLVSDKITKSYVTENNGFSLNRILREYRDYVTEFIRSSIPENEASMLTAMLFGDKSGIETDDKTMFYRTGIGHVMAVSGLHLVLFCGIFSYIFKRTGMNKRIQFVLLEVLMLLFAVCSGLSPSVLRAALMMTIVYAAPLFYRHSDTLNSICISLIILTVGCPFSIRNPSLVLSVTGTFSAGVFAPFISDKISGNDFFRKNIRKIVYMFCVSAGIFPVSVICFGEGSFFSPAANIILTPICMAALLLGMISALTVFVKPVLLVKCAGVLCRIVLNSVRLIGNQKFSYISFDGNAKIIAVVLIIFCILTYFIFKNHKMEVISVLCSWVIFCTSISILNYSGRNDVNIALLGDESIDVVIISRGLSADIIDLSGDKYNCQYAVKYLQSENITEINSISIMSKPYQTMAIYNNSMDLFEVRKVLLPSGTFIRQDSYICGTQPEFSDYSNLTVKYNEYTYGIYNSMIYLYYGDFSFACDSSRNIDHVTVFAEYDMLFEPPECKGLIIPEAENSAESSGEICESNIVVRADKNAEFSVRRL
ncbi:ComEC/Rec2 family competence protein [Porcipelethomonas sp.]|uniref:ComEC/Rec2 family competence protein n=1 Tax=Porcipelethomonas sp. TaxID=2981675 RepID=UPI003EF33110